MSQPPATVVEKLRNLSQRVAAGKARANRDYYLDLATKASERGEDVSADYWMTQAESAEKQMTETVRN